jgi:hypothetical protein
MRFYHIRLLVISFALLVMVIGLMSVSAQTSPTPALTIVYGATQSDPVSPLQSGAARDLPTAPAVDPNATAVEIPRRVSPSGENGARGADFFPFDPLAGTFSPSSSLLQRAFSAPVVNTPGQSYNGVNPSDNIGDVGPAHYVQMVNGPTGARFAIYNKETGVVLQNSTELNFLAPADSPCKVGALGSPIVLYDQYADRWLMAELADAASDAAKPYRLCVYLSDTTNPQETWRLYPFALTEFPEYFRMTVWQDAYYISALESTPALYALDREKMLVGQQATFLRVPGPSLSSFGFPAFTPADADGDLLPDAEIPGGIYIRHVDDELYDIPNVPTNPSGDYLQLFFYNVDFANPNLTTLAGPLEITTSEFDSNLCQFTAFECFDQPGVNSSNLDPLREIMNWRVQYRNFGTYSAIVGNFVTDVDDTDRGGLRWFELRGKGIGWSLHQEGTVTNNDDINRWIGATAMDKYGNIALGYNIVGPNTFPGIRYTGRLFGDTLGQMTQGENVVINGASANSSNLWGEYNAMSVDPVDDCTFWFTANFVPAPQQQGQTPVWSTRISAFRFEVCENGAPSPTLGPTNTNAPATATPQITQTPGPTLTEEVVINGGFEAGLSPWVIKNASRDKVKCNKPGKEFARTGNCAFMFRGVEGEVAKLQQNYTPGIEAFVVGDTFDLRVFVNAAVPTVNATIKLVTKYSDNTQKGKVTRQITTTTQYQEFPLEYMVQSENVQKVKVQIDHRTLSGKMYLDDVSLIWTLIPTAARSGAMELVPLP